MSVVQNIEQNGYRARADRRFQSGRVLDVDPVGHTAVLDVGALLPNGTPVYRYGMPYSPQTPPKAGDSVPIIYTNSSPYSPVICGMQVGANAQTQEFGNGGVTGLHSDSNATLLGVIELASGTNIVLTQVGNIITISSTGGSALSPATSVTDVAATGVVGTSLNYARQDHVHKGVHSFQRTGGAALFGDVTISLAGGLAFTGSSGNDIRIDASGVSSGVISITPSGGTPVTGAITLAGAGGLVVSQSGGTITLTQAAGSSTLTVEVGGAAIGTEPKLNFIANNPWISFAGTADNPGNSRVDALLSVHRPYETVTTYNNSAILPSNSEFILADASGGAFSLTLPAATSFVYPIAIKKIDSSANHITISKAITDQIEGAASYVLTTQYQKVILVGDLVSNWWIFGT